MISEKSPCAECAEINAPGPTESTLKFPYLAQTAAPIKVKIVHRHHLAHRAQRASL